jgi:hypothetical protein
MISSAAAAAAGHEATSAAIVLAVQAYLAQQTLYAPDLILERS